MTLDHAAQAAADRDGLVWDPELAAHARDLYVRAFRQGAQWMQTQETQEVRRAVTADKDTSPSAGSTAADHEVIRPFQSCHCPAKHGEPCPLTLDECAARTDDYVGLPWFGARLRRIWDGFVSESLNGVVCSIPDSGLNTPAHRTWCVRCQRRYMELKALVEMLDPPVTAGAVDPQARSTIILSPTAGSTAATDQG